MTDIFDLSSAAAQDEAQLVIRHPTTDEPTTWIWTFYGPGHPKTIEVANRVGREALDDAAAKEQARVNGKKWKEEREDIETLRAKNVANMVDRTKTFTPVKIGADTIEFSPENARKLLLDRKFSWLLDQVIDFLKTNESFIQPSAKS